MASGVKIDDCIVTGFQDMKLRKSDAKVRFYILSADGKSIVEDEKRVILHSDCEGGFFQCLKSKFCPNTCCFALVDVTYTTGESSKKQVLMLLMWAPEGAKIKDKMIYASSKQALKQKLPGVNRHWELNDTADMTIEQMAQKLCSAKVKSLEDHNF